MAGVSGQGRLLPARLQREKVAPPQVLFQLCRQKKTGAEGRPSEKDGLKTYRNKASERRISVLRCLGASSASRSPHSSVRQQALAGGSLAWRSTRPPQHLRRPPGSTKNICPLTAPCFHIQCCEALCRRGGEHNGKYLAPRRAGGSCPTTSRDRQLCGNSGPEPPRSLHQKLPLLCDRK